MTNKDHWTINYANVNDLKLIIELRNARISRGVSQSTLAESIGIHPLDLANIESHQREPTLETTVAIAHALGYRLALIENKNNTEQDE